MADSPVEYGLSAAGFKRKRLPEIMKDIGARISDTLGFPVQTSANSVLGQLIGVFGFEIADAWEQAENVYNSMYPNTAQGINLSNAAALAGIALIDAEYTTLVATCFGTEGTEIPYGAQITDRTYTYSCTDVYLPIASSRANVIGVELTADAAVGVTYSLRVDDIVQTYTATAQDTATSVLVYLWGLFSFDDRTGTVNNEVLLIEMNDQSKTMEVYAGTNTHLKIIASPFNFMCDEAGAVDPPIGTVTQIVTSYSGWDTVENNVPAAVGRDNETDNSLRQRWSQSVYGRASAMVDAIAAAIFNVDGVTVANVYENTSDTTDADGRPPHSIEAVVLGGDDVAIGEAIWTHKAAGIDTYGTESALITDSQGVQHTMFFNRPEPVDVYFSILLTENPERALSSAAIPLIKQALAEQGNALAVGQDVILQTFYATIMSASNYAVGYIQLTAGTDGETYSTDNVIISPRQAARFDVSRITINMA